jgi:hypothetical protein
MQKRGVISLANNFVLNGHENFPDPITHFVCTGVICHFENILIT